MAQRRKLRVLLLFGGRSGEHEISLRSALTVMGAMDRRRYEVVAVGIARDGRWYLLDDAARRLARAATRLGELRRAGTPVSLLPHPASRALVALGPRGARPVTGPIDVIFPVLHGTYGEDGTVQGLLELTGIPYVGAGVLGSALGMDKDAQKRLLGGANLPIVRYHALARAELDSDAGLARRLADELGYPVFVKPNALGSSIGISRVARPAELKRALGEAFEYDRKILIEAACEGRELECAVLGNDHPEASIPGEIVVHRGHRFYSYESKYVDPEGASVVIPAPLPKRTSARVQALALAAFKTLSLRGMARVDFLARKDLSEIYVNEVNTIPGFTAISMYPKLWAASGLKLPRLVDRLISLALNEHRERSQLSFTYRPKG